MQVVVAGAHGQIALLLHPLLVQRGHRVRGLIRSPDQAATVEAAGAQAVVCDLEAEPDIAEAVGEADLVVFAAGAGPGSGPERKWSLDRDGAIRLMDAARRNAIPRYVMVGVIDSESPRGSDVFQVYLRAKAQADAALRDSGLGWTILRPGRLTDDPGTGRVTIARELERADIPRADVAEVLAEVVDRRETVGLDCCVVSGPTPVHEALGLCLGET